MRSQRGESTSLGIGLRKLMSKLDKGGKVSTAAVIEVWETLVGPEIAKHTWVEGLRNGELLVSVDSPTWANELQAMSGQLVRRLQDDLGQTPVKSMRFTVTKTVSNRREEGRKTQEADRRYGGERVEPEPLTPDELKAIERSVSLIESEHLREAALRATIRDLEWKKGQERVNAAQTPSGGSTGTK